MYTVTFYSFKGGVGRTMAMVNTALALANLGRRVMLIDFDLEAPGLTTFDRLRPASPHRGIVEFVGQYLRTATAPELEEFVFEAPTSSDNPGKTWVIPAGREDAAYRRLLAQINWLDLYREREGFLLFEDMKYQIEKKYKPDYVFIDSRTGHSDVEGICTRHLPDAVVILFFPNEQNLCGLDSVCRNIRAERNTGLKKEIVLHFVMSNVPDLDDEDAILRDRIREFRKRLQFQRLATTIHHYNSLTLLNQSVFVLDRPASRLARQYKKLVDEIVKGNLSDRSGALHFLKEVQVVEYSDPGNERGAPWLEKAEQGIRGIADKFLEDAEVQFAVARAFATLGHVREAVSRLGKLLDDNPDFVEARIERASCLARLGECVGAVQDLMLCLNAHSITEWQVITAVRLLSSLDISKFSEAAVSPAVSSLKPRAKYLLADDVSRNVRSWELQEVKQALISILNSVYPDSPDDPQSKDMAKCDLSLLFIHEGCWEEAIRLLAPAGEVSNRLPDVFNCAMAHWGKLGTVSRDLMQRTCEVISDTEDRLDANFLQCSAIAEWAVDQQGQAMSSLDRAVRLANETGGPIFSCWRYAYVTRKVFLEDCQAIRAMVEGEKVVPQFIEKHLLRRSGSEKGSRIENQRQELA
jgi:MinD-like ATPase involved in chromosome partitioning or flagellar assembly